MDSAYWDGESETKEMIQMEMSEGEEKDKITFRNLPTFQPIYFSVQKPDFQDTFAEAEISFYEEELSGTVTNCSPYQISHVQLLLKDQGLISLGDLQPGETVSLEGKTFLLGGSGGLAERDGSFVKRRGRELETVSGSAVSAVLLYDGK